QIFRDEYKQVLQAAGSSALARLNAIIDVHARFADHPLLPGGCPLLNTAIESDDGHPLLREHVRAAMDDWRKLLAGTFKRGVASGEFRADIDADEAATIIISLIEGGVMLSKLYATPEHLQRAVAHARTYIGTMSRIDS
ncbi:MAG TPA: TetR family transcriptional regulator C-terminal domain-containing protein, partial [Herpetosiphonaceae bacterium]|nr:TetR family transcriptional regulator C-terminal domain-containing protein [Herpetosiphonaceae bacterium]